MEEIFSSKSRIIGIDLNLKLKEYEKYGFEILLEIKKIEILEKFYNKIGKIDILLDDEVIQIFNKYKH